jgi:hypothetical protein
MTKDKQFSIFNDQKLKHWIWGLVGFGHLLLDIRALFGIWNLSFGN